MKSNGCVLRFTLFLLKELPLDWPLFMKGVGLLFSGWRGSHSGPFQLKSCQT